MRPTVQEQLQGTCRILENVIAPCVNDAYARTMLAGLIANLRMLGGAVAGVPAFLVGDNRATAALLARLQPAVAPELGARIVPALAEPEPDATDLRLLEQRNNQLRELLALALRGSPLPPALQAAAVAHMGERAARAPMRYVSTAPTATKTD
jgi:hypothetical protein